MFVKNVNKAKKMLCQYGFWFTLLSFLDATFIRLPDNIFYHYLHKIKYEYVKKYIYCEYHDSIEEELEKQKRIGKSESQIKESRYVWIFWWQGLDGAPFLVQQCIEETKRHFRGSKKVIVVTKDNYLQYVDIPDKILTKVEQGVFTLTFFSDYIRFSLLAKYGGIWVDSTVYITNNFKLPQNLYFYTVKHNLYKDWHVSRGRWTGFFLAFGKNNNGAKLVQNILEKYLLKENTLIAYLLVDVLMDIAYEKVPSFKYQVDKVPVNNSKVFKLNTDLNKIYQENYKIPATINKLSYKQKYEKFKNGKLTVYGKIFNSKYK